MRTPATQIEIPFTGEQLKQYGMQLAKESAEAKSEGWNERCYLLLQEYLKINKEHFMAEFFRQWSEDKIETPPSKRAFGGIMMRAAKAGLIKKVGTHTVTNNKAHRCYASVWQTSAENKN